MPNTDNRQRGQTWTCPLCDLVLQRADGWEHTVCVSVSSMRHTRQAGGELGGTLRVGCARLPCESLVHCNSQCRCIGDHAVLDLCGGGPVAVVAVVRVPLGQRRSQHTLGEHSTIDAHAAPESAAQVQNANRDTLCSCEACGMRPTHKEKTVASHVVKQTS